MPRAADFADRHRASYILERGVWKARCRLCGCEVADPIRRQAAALFRQHIRVTRQGGNERETWVIDLRSDEPVMDIEPV